MDEIADSLFVLDVHGLRVLECDVSGSRGEIRWICDLAHKIRETYPDQPTKRAGLNYPCDIVIYNYRQYVDLKYLSRSASQVLHYDPAGPYPRAIIFADPPYGLVRKIVQAHDGDRLLDLVGTGNPRDPLGRGDDSDGNLLHESIGRPLHLALSKSGKLAVVGHDSNAITLLIPATHVLNSGYVPPPS